MVFLKNSLWIIEMAIAIDIILSIFGITNLSLLGIILGVLLIIILEAFKIITGHYKNKQAIKTNCVDGVDVCACALPEEGFDCACEALSTIISDFICGLFDI